MKNQKAKYSIRAITTIIMVLVIFSSVFFTKQLSRASLGYADPESVVNLNKKIQYYINSEEDSNTYMLYQYSKSTKKETLLKVLKTKGTCLYKISGLYKNLLFITKQREPNKLRTYAYNTSTRTFKSVMNNCELVDSSGKYAIGANVIRHDVSPYPSSIYKITTTGLEKIKQLSRYGDEVCFMKGKLYYSDWKTYDMNKVCVFRANKDGSNPIKIASINNKKDSYGLNRFISIDLVTPKYCILHDGSASDNYKYVYKTKKFTKYAHNPYYTN